jgi:hypothetical protein
LQHGPIKNTLPYENQTKTNTQEENETPDEAEQAHKRMALIPDSPFILPVFSTPVDATPRNRKKATLSAQTKNRVVWALANTQNMANIQFWHPPPFRIMLVGDPIQTLFIPTKYELASFEYAWKIKHGQLNLDTPQNIFTSKGFH